MFGLTTLISMLPVSANAIVGCSPGSAEICTGNSGSEIIAPDVSGCVELQGSPLAGSTVILKQAGELNQTTTTDANGCYEFPTAVSGKKFKVLIKGPVAP